MGVVLSVSSAALAKRTGTLVEQLVISLLISSLQGELKLRIIQHIFLLSSTY